MHQFTDSPPMLIACMACGQLAAMSPAASVNPDGWRYDATAGWRCEPCAKQELPPPRRAGHPPKGHACDD